VTLPGPVRTEVEKALRPLDGDGVLAAVEPVGGGCISPTARVRTGSGSSYFLKWSGPDLPDGLLPAEARGLEALAAAGAVRVPAVVATGRDAPWLLLEWLEPGAPDPGAWRRLGADLARLHGTRGPGFGSEHPNFIGSIPQSNDPSDDWAEFWMERRLEPRLRQALEDGQLGPEDRRRFRRLGERLPDLLGPAAEDGPSLLHGDLWSGNVHMLEDGSPAVIDPSVYYGHREVDLAMADLFGGFGPGFRDAYEEAWPLAPGYAPTRRAVYQLYYLLVHVNLFGGGYVSGTRRALTDAGV
jgi:protein-ribulosamine 3-kinase